MKLNLNIYTNSHASAPSILLVQKTYRSFCDTFGKIKPTIYCDIHPNVKTSKKYIQNLKNQFSDVRVTSSLSDGYVQSIKDSTNDYIFQLEGDWIFHNIKHSLKEIIAIMERDNLYHFRFNKRSNHIGGWDKVLKPRENYVLSNNLSNNPHIINRQFYIDNLLKYIKIVPGSKGIEEELNKLNIYESAIYGQMGDPATITHLDGRGVNKNYDSKGRVKLI